MAMAARRIGAESSVTRALILTTTEQLIRNEGYAAISTRRVATQAGLKPSLVHYYFPTTDDLFIAVFRQGADQSDAMIEAALCAADPLRALWDFFTDTSRTAMSLEFMALANHRKAIRAMLAQHSEDMRARQVEVLSRIIEQRSGSPAPAGLAVFLAGMGRVLVLEGSLGVSGGHAEARAFMEQWLDQLAPVSKASQSTKHN